MRTLCKWGQRRLPTLVRHGKLHNKRLGSLHSAVRGHGQKWCRLLISSESSIQHQRVCLLDEPVQNYNFFMESRSRDLETIAAIKVAREKAVECSRLGQLRSVLDAPSEFEQTIYVVKLLDVHPRLGKVAGRRLLRSLGVSQFDCVKDVSSATVMTILREVGELS